MYPFGDHFLDANILVGSRISFDAQHPSSNNYMNLTKYKRATSKRAYREARGVLERLRRLALQYLEEIHKKFGNLYNPLKVDADLSHLTERFIASLRNAKERNAIRSFLKDNFPLIRDIIKDIALGSRNTYDEFKKDIIKELDSALNSLAIDCAPDPDALIFRYDSCPVDYSMRYNVERKELTSVIKYENDILILLDSYYIKDRHTKSNICFITTDREHILSNKRDIEKILSGICIQPPKFPCAECLCPVPISI